MSTLAATSGRRLNDRKKTAVAASISVVIHLLLILFIAVMLGFRPEIAPPAPPDETPVEITLMDAPPPKPKTATDYIATNESQRAEKPPENPAFESDKDTAAASALPASGDAPLPTMDGETAPGIAFENRAYTPGREPAPAAPPPQPEQQTAPPEPKVETVEKVEKVEPVPTPKPVAQIALLEPPKPKTEPKPEPAKPVVKTPPVPPNAPGYQPQERITRIRGNISNRGRASVAANATPIGRYKKMLSDAIGSRWYYYVNDQIGLLNIGTLEVRFVVKADGKVERIKVVSNSSNESFAACSVQAIMEAEIPPIPKEIVPMLENGRIEIEYSFTIISN